MVEKLYEKYMKERSENPVLEDVALEAFKEKISGKLSNLSRVFINDGAGIQRVFYGFKDESSYCSFKG